MKTETIKCDYCGNECANDYIQAYQIKNGLIYAKEEICLECFNEMERNLNNETE